MKSKLGQLKLTTNAKLVTLQAYKQHHIQQQQNDNAQYSRDVILN